jgi:hypothetical protein
MPMLGLLWPGMDTVLWVGSSVARAAVGTCRRVRDPRSFFKEKPMVTLLSILGGFVAALWIGLQAFLDAIGLGGAA